LFNSTGQGKAETRDAPEDRPRKGKKVVLNLKAGSIKKKGMEGSVVGKKEKREGGQILSTSP